MKIADFGLAKLLGRDPSDRTLTGTHQAMGTPHYMAPEQMGAAARGRPPGRHLFAGRGVLRTADRRAAARPLRAAVARRCRSTCGSTKSCCGRSNGSRVPVSADQRFANCAGYHRVSSPDTRRVGDRTLARRVPADGVPGGVRILVVWLSIAAIVGGVIAGADRELSEGTWGPLPAGSRARSF